VTRGVAVAKGELLDRAAGQVAAFELSGHLEVLRARRHAEWDLRGPARRFAPLALDQPVHRLLRHPPPGGELAAGDREHPR
jgi:hypothetical protein